MSQDQEKPRQTDSLPEGGQQALSALRGVWSAQKQTSADIEEACGNTKACRNMESVGFHGLADDGDPSTKASEAAVGNNLRSAWKSKLERDGKLSTGRSVKDLVFGSSDPDKSNKE